MTSRRGDSTTREAWPPQTLAPSRTRAPSSRSPSSHARAPPTSTPSPSCAIACDLQPARGRPGSMQGIPEVSRLLAALRSEKMQTIAMLAYGAGLRVSEILALERGDIDAKRMLIHIRHAKRGRERYVMLSPRLLAALRAYWKW